MPGRSWTRAVRLRVSRLKRVDLPTLGRPQRATRGSFMKVQCRMGGGREDGELGRGALRRGAGPQVGGIRSLALRALRWKRRALLAPTHVLDCLGCRAAPGDR